MKDNKIQPTDSPDAFARLDYRKMISWSKRIQRESPFLTQLLAKIPEKAVLDLGCGTGEHSRFYAEMGFNVVGIDRSKSMLSQANDSPVPENLRFIQTDILQLSEFIPEQFGVAIALGNTLVSITRDDEIQNAFDQIAKRLLKGGVFLFQILNYARIRSQKIRNLPLNFVQEDNNRETIFLRIMNYHDDGSVDFYPTTLTLDPNLDPPIQIDQSRLIRLRGWILEELVPFLNKSGFEISGFYGDMRQGRYEASSSQDLVVVAKKR